MTLELIHKNSAAEGKEPTPDMLAFGELALNYHASGPFLSCKDSEGRIRRLPGIYRQADPPTSAQPGEVWIDTVNGTALILTPDGWLELGDKTVPEQAAPVIISQLAPTGVIPGDLWWCTADGRLYVFYDDGTSAQWVASTPEGSGVQIIDDGTYVGASR
jgi:hypothetical protein